MKKTSAKNTSSRTAKATGGRASGRTQRAANARSAAAGSRKAATTRTSTSSKSAAKKAVAKPASKVAASITAKPKAKTTTKATPKKAITRRATTPKTAVHNTRAGVARATHRKQTSTKDLLLEFFHDELKDIYWAEKNIIKTLPKMKKAASSKELQSAFDAHLAQTQEHASRLEEVFELLGKKAQAKKCEAMAGIIKEGEEIITDTEAGTATRDVGLILAAQKVEHYEIATYGGLAQLARTLHLDDVAALLETTLQEEKDTDMKLTDIAESHVNYDALEESEGTRSATGTAPAKKASPAASTVGGDEEEVEEADDVEFEEADLDDEEVEDDEEYDDDEEEEEDDDDDEEDEQL